MKTRNGSGTLQSHSDEDAPHLPEALMEGGGELVTPEQSPRDPLLGTDSQAPSGRSKKVTTNNQRGSRITKWTDDEKREIAWCWFYASNSKFQRRGTGERGKQMLLKRGNIEAEKINETANSRFQSMFANMKLGKTPVTSDQLEKIKEEVKLFIKTEIEPTETDWTWSFEANMDLLECFFIGEQILKTDNLPETTKVAIKDKSFTANDFMIHKFKEKHSNCKLNRKIILKIKNNLLRTIPERKNPRRARETIPSKEDSNNARIIAINKAKEVKLTIEDIKEMTKYKEKKTRQQNTKPPNNNSDREHLSIPLPDTSDSEEEINYHINKGQPGIFSQTLPKNQSKSNREISQFIQDMREYAAIPLPSSSSEDEEEQEIRPERTINSSDEKERSFNLQIENQASKDNCNHPENNELEISNIEQEEEHTNEENEEKEELRAKILTEIEENNYIDINNRNPLPKLSNSKKLNKNIELANEILPNIISSHPTITEVNKFFYATATAIIKHNNIRIPTLNRNKKKNNQSKPPWIRDTEERIKDLRSEISILTEKAAENIRSERSKRKARIIMQREQLITLEDIKQAITRKKLKLKAETAKQSRQNKLHQEKKQNKLFAENPTKFYRTLKDDTIAVKNPPKKEEIDQFWRTIYENDQPHNINAEWIQNIQNENINQMQYQEITEDQVKEKLQSANNWKSPGPDQVHNFWLKKLDSLTPIMTKSINTLINNQFHIPEWLTTGNTILIPKTEETHLPNKYRPITCLPTMYKLITGLLTDKINNHITENNIIAEEQKGCTQATYGTKDQLLINKTILDDCRKRQRNLCTTWIDYKKAYDSIPHSWIKQTLHIYKIHPTVRNFITNSMTNWKTKLILTHDKGTITTDEIHFKRGIFQGDSMSPLLFVLAINPLSSLINRLQNGYKINPRDKQAPRISHLFYMDDLKLYSPNKQEMIKQMEIVKQFSEDIKMDFGLEKCATLTIKKGKRTDSESLIIGDLEIKEIEQESVYKYLGIEETETIEHKKMKEKITTEYIRRVKMILKSQLNSKNKIQAINSLAIPTISYSFGIIDWAQHEINKIDTKTRKMLHAHKVIYKNQCTPRIYIQRSEGGLGLLEIDQVHKNSIIGLNYYIQNNNSTFINIVKNEELRKPPRTSIIKKATDYQRQYNIDETLNIDRNNLQKEIKKIKKKYKDARIKNSISNWEQNTWAKHYRIDVLNKEYLDKKTTNQVISRSLLRNEDERIIIAAQDQALQTNWFKKNIQHQNISEMCRLCNNKIETVSHILSGCDILQQRDVYTKRHNAVCQLIHYKLCKKYNIPTTTDHHWEHRPELTIENDQVLITYDYEIPTDITPRCRPDIIIKDKISGKTQIIEVGIPADHRIAAYEREKILKYQQLKYEIRRLWNTEPKIIPIIIGATGAAKKTLKENINEIDESIQIAEMQKEVLRKSVNILQFHLGV